jgi:hypothetical protein
MSNLPAVPNPVSEWSIEVGAVNFRAKIQVASAEPDSGYWHSRQYTALLERLIAQADTGAWEGSPAEVQPPEFYARLLAALARHYRVDLPAQPDSPAAVIEMLLIDVQDLAAELLAMPDERNGDD